MGRMRDWWDVGEVRGKELWEVGEMGDCGESEEREGGGEVLMSEKYILFVVSVSEERV